MAAHRLFVIVTCLLAATPAPAQQRERGGREPAPEAFQRAIQCRAIQAPPERLACYDREVAALENAEASNAIRVVDRAQVQRTRRSLFGLVLPDINIFGGGNEENSPEAVTEINSTIQAFSQGPRGQYTFTLEDGARWVQLDTREFSARVRVGQPIRIRRAAMGSFLANVNNQTAIRVRRVN